MVSVSLWLAHVGLQYCFLFFSVTPSLPRCPLSTWAELIFGLLLLGPPTCPDDLHLPCLEFVKPQVNLKVL